MWHKDHGLVTTDTLFHGKLRLLLIEERWHGLSRLDEFQETIRRFQRRMLKLSDHTLGCSFR
jgi:hypothetical protein